MTISAQVPVPQPVTVSVVEQSATVVHVPTGPPGPEGPAGGVSQDALDAAMIAHHIDPEPHAAYDDIPPLATLFANHLL